MTSKIQVNEIDREYLERLIEEKLRSMNLDNIAQARETAQESNRAANHKLKRQNIHPPINYDEPIDDQILDQNYTSEQNYHNSTGMDNEYQTHQNLETSNEYRVDGSMILPNSDADVKFTHDTKTEQPRSNVNVQTQVWRTSGSNEISGLTSNVFSITPEQKIDLNEHMSVQENVEPNMESYIEENKRSFEVMEVNNLKQSKSSINMQNFDELAGNSHRLPNLGHNMSSNFNQKNICSVKDLTKSDLIARDSNRLLAKSELNYEDIAENEEKASNTILSMYSSNKITKKDIIENILEVEKELDDPNNLKNIAYKLQK